MVSISKRRAVWLTDIHLEFLGRDEILAFLEDVKQQQPDVVLISGDIGTAAVLRAYVTLIVRSIQRPICFILGNHDFYGSDIPDVRADMRALTRESFGGVWLPAAGIVQLTPGVGLVGHDGWSDGRYGDYHKSGLMLNDYVQIKTLAGLTPGERLSRLRRLADEAADYLRGIIPQALMTYDHLFVMMHPPPFQETCWHKGRASSWDNPYLPHFTSKALGDLMLDMAGQYPQKRFTVLCGHTHGAGQADIRPNLRVLAGGAEYGKPRIQKVFELI